MNKFSDLNINKNLPMSGEKIKIKHILNQLIIIKDYKIIDSKYNKNKSGKCLEIQIIYNSEIRVVFTGSDVLIDQIKQIDKNFFPLETTITQNGDYFTFN